MMIGESEYPKTKILEQRRKIPKVIYGDFGVSDNIFILFFQQDLRTKSCSISLLILRKSAISSLKYSLRGFSEKGTENKKGSKKIEKAKFLLSCKTYTHSEIANLCGFNDTKYFYIVFKKITKTTTKNFQKSNKNIDFFKTS